MSAAAPQRYDHAIVRVVPRVERGEFVNVGAIVSSVDGRFLKACIELDEVRARALDPSLDVATLRAALDAFVAVCDGRPGAGPIARLAPRERFRWLVAPRSSVVQTSPTHTGGAVDLDACLERLLRTMVRPPGPPR